MIGRKGFVVDGKGWILSGLIVGETEKEILIYLEDGLYILHKEYCHLSLEDAMKSQIERRRI